jgi:hypothetical protein
MGFKDVRALLIECLEQGRWSAEVRRDIDVKNELATGEMQPEKAIHLLQRCRGDQYGSSPYHANRKIACHEFKPVDVGGSAGTSRRTSFRSTPFSSAYTNRDPEMHFWKEGDESEAICHDCDKIVTTRYAVRTVRLSEGGIEVPGVLAGVCTECDRVVSLPAQSAPKIKEARDRRKAETLEAKVPAQIDDMIHLLAAHFATAVEAFRADLLRFYLREVASDQAFAERVRDLGDSELAQGRTRARVSLRAPAELLESARERAHQAGVETDAALLRGIVLAAVEDVLEGKSPDRRIRLGGAAQAEGAPRMQAA